MLLIEEAKKNCGGYQCLVIVIYLDGRIVYREHHEGVIKICLRIAPILSTLLIEFSSAFDRIGLKDNTFAFVAVLGSLV